MPTKQYEVVEPVNHNLKNYNPGNKLELEEDAAQPLLELGKIKEVGGQRESTLPPVVDGIGTSSTTEADLLQNLPSRAERETELKEKFDKEGWKSIQAIAQIHGIVKPAGGWDGAIPLILDREFPPNNEPPLTTP